MVSKEHLKRQLQLDLAKNDYKAYLKTIKPNFDHSPFSKMLCEVINDLVEYEKKVEEISKKFSEDESLSSEESAFATSKELERLGLKPKRIMIFAPPQHGKSETITKHAPGYYLNHFPENTVLTLSYDADTAREFGRENYMDLDNYSYEIFGNRLAKNRRAQDDFGLEKHHGKALFKSIKGGVTSQPGHLIIIDDPVKGFDDVNSDTLRERLWSNYTGNVLSRLAPTASMLIILTRWHEDDLAGRILRYNEELKRDNLPYEEWDILMFPCLCEDPENDLLGRELNEPLVPYRNGKPYRDITWVTKQKTAYAKDMHAWNCLYQCNPIPNEMDSLFKNSYFQFYTELPKFKRVITSWDCNFKGKKKGADFIVGQVWGETEDNNYYLIHQVRDLLTLQDLKDKIIQTDIYYQPKKNLIEAKANGDAVIDLLDGSVSNIEPINTNSPKESRAQVLAVEFAMGKIWLPHPSNAPWIVDYVDEFKKFPFGVNDDQVDSSSQAIIYLTQTKAYKIEKRDGSLVDILKRKRGA